MKSMIKQLLAGLASAVALSACGWQDEAPPAKDTYRWQPKPAQAVAPCDTLAIQVFRHLAQHEAGNIAFSPASMESALKLLSQGAAGATRQELTRLAYGTPATGAIAMRVENHSALFVAEGAAIRPEHTSLLVRVPFSTSTAQSADIINTWARKRTHGKISAVVNGLHLKPNTILVAANAVYLNEKWMKPFLKSNTKQQAFHTAPGKKLMVPMMHLDEEMLYAEGADWQAIALFYHRQNRPESEPGCFIGILPKGDASKFAAQLTPDKYNAIRRALATTKRQEVKLYLPRFTVQSSLSLSTALQAQGVHQVFTQAADFSNFIARSATANAPMMLTDILQSCYVKVDEQGTEAAAVTLMPVAVQSLPMPTKEIYFDRPFLWVITDLTSSAPPYFMGLVAHPEQP